MRCAAMVVSAMVVAVAVAASAVHAASAASAVHAASAALTVPAAHPVPAAAGHARPHPFTPHDALAIRGISDPRLSPDGAWVAYVVSSSDSAKDKASTDVWMTRWDGTRTVQLTHSAASENTPRWSPDSRAVAFLSGREQKDDHTQLWVLPVDGGEARCVTHVGDGLEDFAWSPDGTRCVLQMMDPDPADSLADDAPKPPLVLDRFTFKNDDDGYLTARYRHLYLLDLTSGRVDTLTRGAHDDLMPAWSPDGRTIAFVTKRGADPDRTYNWDVYLIAAHAGAVERQLTTSLRSDATPDDGAPPVWSPDGSQIAYVRRGAPELSEYASVDVVTAQVSDGREVCRTPTLDRACGDPRWSTDGRFVYFTLADDAEEQLARVAVEAASSASAVSSASVASSAPVERVLSGLRSVAAFDCARGGHVVALVSTLDAPAEIFAIEGHALRRLTHQNDSLMAAVRVASTATTRFTSSDATEIHGFVTRAIDAVAGQPSPAVLRLHGGPCSQFATSWSTDAQILAAHGYAVIRCNPRGSSARGEAFATAIRANWGQKDVEDVLAAVDDAVKRGIADPARLAVGGWSYGGILTNYVIASDHRFRAAVSGASQSNIWAGYGTDEYTRDYEAELGPPWKNPDAWTRISYPFLHADRITTPTLFLAAEKDFNVPALNSEQMYQALKSLSVPTGLVIYPGQHHGLTKPSYIRDRFERTLEWCDAHVKAAGAVRP